MQNYKIRLTYLLLFASFSLMITVTSCDDSVTADEIDSRTIPDQNVDYYEHIQPVFNLKCATSFCHDDQTRAAGLSLTSYANATADPNIVFPGDPEVSKLVWAIEGTGGVEPMPPPGPIAPLTENQVKGIRTWIQEGARVSPPK